MALQVGSGTPPSQAAPLKAADSPTFQNSSAAPLENNMGHGASRGSGYVDALAAKPVVDPRQVDNAHPGSIANSPDYHGKHAQHTSVSTPSLVSSPSFVNTP